MSKKRRSNDWYERTYGVAGTGGKNRAGQGASTSPGEGTELTSGPTGVSARMIETVESTECIVGYRNWSLTETYPDGYLLWSNQSTVWTPFKRIEASCKPMHYPMAVFTISMSRYAYPQESERTSHPSPDPTGKCFCGINAWRDRVSISRADNIQVAGAVNLWGSVIEYPEGFRGQYAYPKELIVYGRVDGLDKIAMKLELAYGVPCQVWE